MLALGLNLGLTTRRGKGGVLKRYMADGRFPSMVMDFERDFYAVGAQRKALSDILTLTRGSTATYIGDDGIMRSAGSNIARLDYSTGKRSFLFETQSTNVAFYGSDPTHANINRFGGGTTLVESPTNAPDGTKMGRLTITGSNNGIGIPCTRIAATPYIFSCYVRLVSGVPNELRIDVSDGAYIDLGAQLVTGQTVRVFGVLTSGNVQARLDIICMGACVIDIWGWQLEAVGGGLDNPSSYIPTPSNAAVTRATDNGVIAKAIVDTFWNHNQAEGNTVLLDNLCTSSMTWTGAFHTRGATTDNRNIIMTGGEKGYRGESVHNGGNQGGLGSGHVLATGDHIKSAYQIKNADFKWCQNGGAVNKRGTGTAPLVETIGLCKASNDQLGQAFYATRKCVIYPRGISDAELQRITV